MGILFPQLGTSPLHLAAQYGHYSTAEVLLRAGVSRDARTKVDRTPLHMAAADGHAHIVELLVRVKQDLWRVCIVKETCTSLSYLNGWQGTGLERIKFRPVYSIECCISFKSNHGYEDFVFLTFES